MGWIKNWAVVRACACVCVCSLLVPLYCKGTHNDTPKPGPILVTILLNMYTHTSWWRPLARGFWVSTGAMKSHGMTFVPIQQTERTNQPVNEYSWVHEYYWLTLVDELIECMLPIGSWFSPHNRTSGVADSSSLSWHWLPIWLHISLEHSAVHTYYSEGVYI